MPEEKEAHLGLRPGRVGEQCLHLANRPLLRWLPAKLRRHGRLEGWGQGHTEQQHKKENAYRHLITATVLAFTSHLFAYA
jgi:hypothetical protein